MNNEIEVARLLNVKVNTNTGQVYLEMEITDPVWKQKVLSEWQVSTIKLVIEKNKDNDAIKDNLEEEKSDVYDLYPETLKAVRDQIKRWK